MADKALARLDKKYTKGTDKIKKDHKITKSDLSIITKRTNTRIGKANKSSDASYKKAGSDLKILDSLLKSAITEGNELSRQNILNQQNSLGILGSGVGTFDEDAMLASNRAAIMAKNNQANNKNYKANASRVFSMNTNASNENLKWSNRNADKARNDALEQAKEQYEEQKEYLKEQAAQRRAFSRGGYGGYGGYGRRGYGGYGGYGSSGSQETQAEFNRRMQAQIAASRNQNMHRRKPASQGIMAGGYAGNKKKRYPTPVAASGAILSGIRNIFK